jgi:hypothetical protein
MIYIEQNATNTIFVNVSEFKTLSNPYYLWRIQNAQGREIISFIPENITSTYPSNYANKYDVFTFNTFLSGATNYIASGGTPVNLNLEHNNEYWLGIYETSVLSTNVNYAGEKLLTSLAFIFVDATSQTYTGNTGNTANNVIYNPNATPAVQPSPTPSITPTSTPTTTPTITPSTTPTNTPSITPTNTPSPTATITPSITPTITPSISPSPTNTLTPTPTNTPTPSASPYKYDIGDGLDNWVGALLVDGNDDVYVGGAFLTYDNNLCYGLLKTNNMGQIDTTFVSGANQYGISTGSTGVLVYGMAEDETGDYVYVYGSFGRGIRKIHKTTGNDAWSANTMVGNGAVQDIAVDTSTGDVYMIGSFTLVGGLTRNRICKLNSSGIVSTTAFTGTAFNTTAYSCIINRNGRLVVSGAFTTYNGIAAARLLEIELSTYTNTGFWGAGASQTNQKIFQRQDNGDYVFVGNAGTISGITIGKVAKFTEAGVNIPYTTGLGGIVPFGFYVDEVNEYIYISNSQGIGIRRYEYSGGTTDTAFETALTPLLPTSNVGQAYTDLVALNSNNKIYYGGLFSIVAGQEFQRIIRLNQDGSINTISS